MSHIQELVHTIEHYQSLAHHSDPMLAKLLHAIQSWQKDRMRRTNATLFDDPKTAPLANYLIDRIYGDDAFDILAKQLHTAGQNAINGSGRLEKLIPSNVLGAGVLGVKSAIQAVVLDLQLAHTIINNDDLQTRFQNQDITDELMILAYQLAEKQLGAKSERIAQIHEIAYVCEQSDKYFNSFIIQKTFGLAKNTAYEHGYQPLYDFIHDGLTAMKHIKRIDDFTEPFVKNELAVIDAIHRDGKLDL